MTVDEPAPTLFSYPGLFGLADNNPYGLKVFAFLKLSSLPFRHAHLFDAREAPRAQLPYLCDGDATIGDSDTIIAHLTASRNLSIDNGLTAAQRDTSLLLNRLLDDLYWVMSYSRWKDPAFWPQFRAAFLSEYPHLGAEALEAARDYNFKRYHHQGIGRYEPPQVYARGLADLAVLANLLPPGGFIFGAAPHAADAALYGFIANMLFFEIDTPMRQFLHSQPHLMAYCQAVHGRVSD